MSEEYNLNSPARWHWDTSTGDVPKQMELDSTPLNEELFIKQLQKITDDQKMQTQQYPWSVTQPQPNLLDTHKLAERLTTVEENLKTILNMLKLIFGAQLDRDEKEKEAAKNYHSTKS